MASFRLGTSSSSKPSPEEISEEEIWARRKQKVEYALEKIDQERTEQMVRNHQYEREKMLMDEQAKRREKKKALLVDPDVHQEEEPGNDIPPLIDPEEPEDLPPNPKPQRHKDLEKIWPKMRTTGFIQSAVQLASQHGQEFLMGKSDEAFIEAVVDNWKTNQTKMETLCRGLYDLHVKSPPGEETDS